MTVPCQVIVLEDVLSGKLSRVAGPGITFPNAHKLLSQSEWLLRLLRKWLLRLLRKWLLRLLRKWLLRLLRRLGQTIPPNLFPKVDLSSKVLKGHGSPTGIVFFTNFEASVKLFQDIIDERGVVSGNTLYDQRSLSTKRRNDFNGHGVPSCLGDL